MVSLDARLALSVYRAWWRGAAPLVACCVTLWIHGASVGECLSALPLVALALSPQSPLLLGTRSQKRVCVVLSTSTPAARELLRTRLAAETEFSDAVCVFAPLDHPEWVARFLDTWRPDAGLWIESELWPNLILEAAKREIRIGVVNGRMSESSFRRWRLPVLRHVARTFMQPFSMVLCQNEQNARRFKALGASAPEVLLNLKFGAYLTTVLLSNNVAADTLVAFVAAKQTTQLDGSRVAQLQRAVGDRSAWLAVSTHEGEETQIAETHVQLTQQLRAPVLTVIIPRHPERAASIVDELRTQGETELFFAAIPTVFERSPRAAATTQSSRSEPDVVEQINAAHARRPSASDAVTPHASASAATVICTVNNATELAQGLSNHFESLVSRSCATEHQELLRTLAVQSLQSHERKLLEWLGAHDSSSSSGT
ncbi:hypothetical protein PybrP1_008551 [[Pythium] brassicae (nom. inval.)]|nr:hypothetical protein PybrP1_008551 [[Pythium] brassicae (nom. inval.)]